MSYLRRLLGKHETRDGLLPWNDLWGFFTYEGHRYPYGGGFSQTLEGAKQEIADGSYASYAQLLYEGNGTVFACILARVALFSEARFQYRRVIRGRPGDLFGDDSLAILERPWEGGTTGDLLTKMLVHHDLAGNAFVARRRGGLRVLRPDWTDIIVGSPYDADVDGWDVDADVMGHVYWPGGRNSGEEPELFVRGEVAHFRTNEDPFMRFRGMSWLTPVVREVAADSAARDHKLLFFQNAGTPNMVVRLPKESSASLNPNAFKQWVDEFKKLEPRGREVYKTLYLAGGADVSVVGSDLKQMDFKVTQGAGETRIAAAAGVPPIIVGLSEGLEAATYSNYGQARRRFADLTMRPLWRNVAGSLEVIVPPPTGAMLWYDDRDIPFLAEDRRDASEVSAKEAQTIRTLVDAGYEPDSVVAAVKASDWTLLDHSGLYSVQLQAPGSSEPEEPSTPQLALVAEASKRLVAAGIRRPTVAQIAEEAGISERTMRRWRHEG